MALSDKTSTATDAKTDTDKSSEPTSSTSATDASTTAGAAAAGVQAPTAAPSSAGGAATAQQDSTVKVQIEQAPAEPDVLYPGDASDATNPARPHVKADYKPFKW
ncbi:hypothetical protein Jolie2_60 [Mycobacterium phage Jolie2]|uniref:Uncharacterized protein n=1 Tax=Mycobacterium phage Jolie2 TaxID=1458831 RepID=W8EI37_9CAUD|nr:hypothetical protein Jolie2_60 [Mycobacterium phage Jolie2]AHJ86610.1 hypothetical protein Jolie2_60 [Mycobacterium phage Jolie2]